MVFLNTISLKKRNYAITLSLNGIIIGIASCTASIYWNIYWTGLDWIGLDWTGLDWTGLDWIGLDWTGLDLTGLDYATL